MVAASIQMLEGPTMKRLISLAAATLVAASAAAAGEIPAHIEAAVDNPMRSEENRVRDGDRKPGKVLAFFGVEEGMNVVDLASSGGYFTEILAGAVGPEGSVSAHNTAGERFDQRREALEAQYAPFGNITLDPVEAGAPLPYEDGSVDLVLLSLIIHHLHYSEESGEAMPPRSEEIYADVKRVLKPGGVFAIIEHKAADDASRADSASWHRIPEPIMKADVTSAGFVFDGSAEKIHYNPDDDLKNNWTETGLRGKTTRLVHRYKKPME